MSRTARGLEASCSQSMFAIVLAAIMVASIGVFSSASAHVHHAQNCAEEIVTDSSLDGTLTLQSCMIGRQAGIAKWKEEHPIYRSDAWHIERYKYAAGPDSPRFLRYHGASLSPQAVSNLTSGAREWYYNKAKL